MSQRDDANSAYTDEVRRAIGAAFDAITEWRTEVTSSSEKVVARIAEAARALGWPDPVVSGIVNQMQSAAKMQFQMMDRTMEVWHEQIKSWPTLGTAGNWPDAEALNAMSASLARFWSQTGEQWQKNWAQMMMSQWTKSSSRRNVPPKTEDRE